jgi:outer membrane protein
MNRYQKLIVLSAVSVSFVFDVFAQDAKVWSLKECLDYALENNITIKKDKLSESTAETDLKKAKAALQPSLSASVTQSLNYRPFQESAGNFVNGTMTSSTSNKTTESGSYGINARWSVWDGGVNRNTIKLRQGELNIARLQTSVEANSIQEKIMQYYVQILYSKEAVNVNKNIFAKDSLAYVRAQEMQKNGKMSRSEVKQLEAAMSESKYSVVNSQTVVDQYLLELRQLLELQPGSTMDVANAEVSDAAAMGSIPEKLDVYNTALSTRPELQKAQENINSSALQLKIAKAGYMPTVSLTAGIGDNHMTGTQTDFGKQMKYNLTGSLGVTLSIPILDNREAKSAVEKAKISQTTAQLDLQDTQKTLYSTIERYWQNAVSNQQRYIAAKSSVGSQEENYNSISEQFKEGLKNVVELTTARTSLLEAEQKMLESKYTTLLNMQLLKFYSGGTLNI